MTTRHLRRLFMQHARASPTAVATTRRVQRAKRLVDDDDADVLDRIRCGIRERAAIQRRVSCRVSTAANRRSQNNPQARGRSERCQ